MKGETGRGGIKRESDKGSFSRKGDTPAAPRQMRAVDIGDSKRPPKVDGSGSPNKIAHGEVFHGATEVGGTRRITGSKEFRVPVSTTRQHRRAIDAGARAGRPGTPAWEFGKRPVTTTVRARSELGALAKAAGPTATVLRIMKRL